MRLVDQTNHPVVLDKEPLRIVSLVPSQTELLYYLDLDKETIGITKFCVHPKTWHQSKERVGGTKTCDIEKIRRLKPHLIIANKEENTKEDIEKLRKEFQVYTSDIQTLEDAYQMMQNIGQLTNRKSKADQIIDTLKEHFKDLPKINRKVLYLIWKRPYMSAGSQTFITTVLNKIGLENAHQANLRYDEITEAEISQINPDFIFLSSEPYPFKDKHLKELEALSDARVLLVDGEMFSWYGSRLLDFKTYYLETLRPQLL